MCRNPFVSDPESWDCACHKIAPAEMSLAFTTAQKTLQSVKAMLPRLVTSGVVVAGEPTLYVEPANLQPVCDFLKSHTGTRCKALMDVTAIDVPTREKRFEVAYQLLSVEHNSRIRVKTLVGGHEGDSGVPSLAGMFTSANWLEREVWDMYGIYFEGHPDLRRILTDYGFQGHPLRKDFPLSGFVECRYDPSKKRVVTEPLELTQEFRQFNFLSPWQEK